MANLRLVGFSEKGSLIPPGISDNGLVNTLAIGTPSSFSVLDKANLDSLLVLTSGIDATGLHHHDTRYFTKPELQTNITNLTGADRLSASNPFGGFSTIQQVLQALHEAVLEASSMELEWQNSVLSKDLTAPPVSPVAGSRYLIGLNLVGTASGAWTGQDGRIATWNGTSWSFVMPTVGTFLSVDDEPNSMYYFNGGAWEFRSFEATTASGFLEVVAGDVRLSNLNSKHIIVGNITNEAVALDTDTLGHIEIAEDTGLILKELVVTNEHIASTAEIETSKLEYADPGDIIVYDFQGFAVVQTPSGDIAISDTAEFTIKPLAVKSGMIDWGAGAGQIDDSDVPANSTPAYYAGGATLRDELEGIDAAFGSIQSAASTLSSEDLTFLKLNGSRSMTGDLNMDSNDILGATKIEVDIITDADGNSSLDISPVDAIVLYKAIEFDGAAKKIENLADGSVSTDAVNFGQLSAVESAATAGINTKVSKAGDTMTGALAMSSNKITGIANGTNPADAVSFSQLDTKLDKSGGAITGILSMSSNKITNLSNGVDPTDAVNKSQLDAVESSLSGDVSGKVERAGDTMAGDLSFAGTYKVTNIADGTNATDAVNLSQLNTKLDATLKGAANGLAELDANGHVPASQLPSFVDDVVESADYASLPTTGETGKIYVTLNDNKTYRWSGSVYVEISASPGSTDSVTEGALNLYFTTARARAAAVIDSMAGSELDQAPSVASAKIYIDDADALKIDLAEKGVAEGVAELNTDGVVPTSQMNPDAYTKVLQVADIPARDALVGTKESDIIRVLDNGSGYPETFTYTGSGWISLGGAGAVLTVNGLDGDVVLTTTDIAEGTNLYYTEGRFDTSFAGKSTTSLAEGTNLYHTQARARTAAVVNSMTGTQTDQAPSVSAVKDFINNIEVELTLFKNEVFELDLTDLSNGYLDLEEDAIQGSVLVYPKHGLPQVPGEDFTLSIESGVTRIALDASFLSTLSVGDKIVAYYAYNP